MTASGCCRYRLLGGWGGGARRPPIDGRDTRHIGLTYGSGQCILLLNSLGDIAREPNGPRAFVPQ